MSAEVWQEWEGLVSEAPAEAENPLLRAAPAVAARLQAAKWLTKNEAAAWGSLGITVRQESMRASGKTMLATDGLRHITVRQQDLRSRKRFTAAHEVGHLLLQAAPLRWRERASLAKVEKCCDEFAAEVLLPSEAVERTVPNEIGPAEIVALCRQRDVSVAVALAGLRRKLSSAGSLGVSALFSGHWRRPDDIDYRVVSARGVEAVFVPSRQRLSSIGFVTLAEEGRLQPRAQDFSGSDVVTLSVRDQRKGTSWTRVTDEVPWQAMVLDDRHTKLVIVLDCAQLLAGRSSAAPRRRVESGDRPRI